MTFKTIHTLNGLIALAAAESSGTPINITNMAVGDGNGNPVEPSEAQTALVREMYRHAPNRVYQDPTTPNKYTAELIVPASVGGFSMREVGVFDSHGNLFVVGNLPETYKPVDTEGAFADTVVRVDFIVSNASAITLQVDPNVAVATQSWVSNNVTAGSIIPGGTTGQFLAKNSNANGDVEWVDPAGITVAVNMVEENQTLVTDQTVVNLATVTTTGLAVYVSGERLRNNEWSVTGGGNTQITLAVSYPDGSKITLVQNEPAGTLPDPLVKSQNLNDLPNKVAARSNLDVYNKDEADASGQAGDIKYTLRDVAPTGWLKANGAAVSRTVYSRLFAVIGTYFGAGDGFNTFNLPDLRGEFIRCLDDGRGVDPNRVLGSWQVDQNAAHTHTGVVASAGSHIHTGSATASGAHNHTATIGTAGLHSHTATADSVGDHTHQIPEGAVAPGGGSRYTSGDDRTDNLDTYSTSQPAGAHNHAISVSSAGSHSHTITVANSSTHTHTLSIDSASGHTHSFTSDSSGGATGARPRNLAFLAVIKY
jgi:phage-related tail fiber protein